MVSERLIRHVIDVLREADASPCSCAETGHEPECRFGSAVIRGVIDCLRWVTDQDSNFGKVISDIEGELDRREAERN